MPHMIHSAVAVITILFYAATVLCLVSSMLASMARMVLAHAGSVKHVGQLPLYCV
jgi:hypothetical protein